MLFMPKATIKVADSGGSFQNASVSIPGSGDCKCLFNPAEFVIQRSANYVEHKIPGLDRPIIQFINGEAEVMKFSLFFDTYSAGPETGNLDLLVNNIKPTLLKTDVRKFTEPFYKLLDVTEDKHAPNLVSFEWGKTKFAGYIIDISQKFTLFSPNGVPLRATLEITLKSNKKDNNIRNSPDRTKHRVVKNGDALFAFAYAEYGDCSQWRRIAETNGIDNPRRLRSGESIVIPAIIR
ncbi:CIS tube protein [Desulfitobacterium hafniense]|uniref:CIS tube protein n=1 Tax=Desulfitobacterium hafniense TaxID=49338 RepID=UPI000362AC36|nr:LysM peptidoglycan-binding domain-containing protein [Desulfitobacterium hafniense]